MGISNMKKAITILGHEVTRSEILIVCFCSILFPLMIPVYVMIFGLNWSLLQLLIAFGLAFDIMSGCLVYNTFRHKEIRYNEKKLSGSVKHALLHMQPLVVAAFFTQDLLLYIGLYWLIMYIVFVLLFEPVSRVKKKNRRYYYLYFHYNKCCISRNLFFAYKGYIPTSLRGNILLHPCTIDSYSVLFTNKISKIIRYSCCNICVYFKYDDIESTKRFPMVCPCVVCEIIPWL